MRHATDLTVATVAAAIGVAVLALVPSQIAGESLAAVGNTNSPAFFPIVMAGVLLLASTVLLVRALATPRHGVRAGLQFDRVPQVAATAAVIIGYAVAVRYLGFFSASFLMILLMPRALDCRYSMAVPVMAIAVPASIYLLFERLLLILLPVGVLR